MSIPQIFHKRQLPPRPVRSTWCDKGSALEGGETSLELGQSGLCPHYKGDAHGDPWELAAARTRPSCTRAGRERGMGMVGVAGAVFTAGFRGDGISSLMGVQFKCLSLWKTSTPPPPGGVNHTPTPYCPVRHLLGIYMCAPRHSTV